MRRLKVGSKFLASRQKLPIYWKSLPFFAHLAVLGRQYLPLDRQFLPPYFDRAGKNFSRDSNGLAFTIH
jgi:hypothetical protein